MSSIPHTLSRTSSVTSTATNTSSDDLYATFISESADTTSRRTRKRFTNAQLTMLEQLFHQNSHPSREQREMCARSCNMEVKSVTIWFQNKRQTERRTTLASGRVPPPVIIKHHHRRAPSPAPSHSPSMASAASSRSRSTTTSTSASSTSSSASRRPSLDCIASRSELRAPAPRTPSRRHDPRAPLWENMPSSPLGPQFSPPAREFVAFGEEQMTRTLEWACARRRLKGRGASAAGGLGAVPGLSSDDEDTTDVEPHEAVTPPGTWGEGDARWVAAKGGIVATTTTKTNSVQAGRTQEPDDDTMKAALALCGLMRG